MSLRGRVVLFERHVRVGPSDEARAHTTMMHHHDPDTSKMRTTMMHHHDPDTSKMPRPHGRAEGNPLGRASSGEEIVKTCSGVLFPLSRSASRFGRGVFLGRCRLLLSLKMSPAVA